MSAHGLMHMVISNAHAGDPYKIDTLFMYMANMSWNSSMNTGGVMEMLTDKDEDGDYVIPHIIYSDAYSSEMVAYADLILPDTTYLERHDCISLLDRPICEADAVADAIRWPVVEPDRDVRGFQSVLCDLGAKLGLPGFVNEDGSQKYADYADYITNHDRRPGIGPLAGWRMGEKGLQGGRGDANEGQIDNYIENGGFWIEHVPERRLLQTLQHGLSGLGGEDGLVSTPCSPISFSSTSNRCANSKLAAEGIGDTATPRASARADQSHDGPAADLVSHRSRTGMSTRGIPVHALTQRPWRCIIHGARKTRGCARSTGTTRCMCRPRFAKQRFKDGDWARVTSPHGAITVPVAQQASLNENTVWTWNAIGKRKGAWALDKDAPEATKGFLLNHLIHELLPPKGDGLRWANSDPITGQAAWFDLRVKIEKSARRKRRSLSCRHQIARRQRPRRLAWKVGK